MADIPDSLGDFSSGLEEAEQSVQGFGRGLAQAASKLAIVELGLRAVLAASPHDDLIRLERDAYQVAKAFDFSSQELATYERTIKTLGAATRDYSLASVGQMVASLKLSSSAIGNVTGRAEKFVEILAKTYAVDAPKYLSTLDRMIQVQPSLARSIETGTASFSRMFEVLEMGGVQSLTIYTNALDTAAGRTKNAAREALGFDTVLRQTILTVQEFTRRTAQGPLEAVGAAQGAGIPLVEAASIAALIGGMGLAQRKFLPGGPGFFQPIGGFMGAEVPMPGVNRQEVLRAQARMRAQDVAFPGFAARARGFMGSPAGLMTAGFALGEVGSRLERSKDTETAGRALQVGGTVASFAAMGALAGPWGAAVGALVGAGVELFRYLQNESGRTLEEIGTASRRAFDIGAGAQMRRGGTIAESTEAGARSAFLEAQRQTITAVAQGGEAYAEALKNAAYWQKALLDAQKEAHQRSRVSLTLQEALTELYFSTLDPADQVADAARRQAEELGKALERSKRTLDVYFGMEEGSSERVRGLREELRVAIDVEERQAVRFRQAQQELRREERGEVAPLPRSFFDLLPGPKFEAGSQTRAEIQEQQKRLFDNAQRETERLRQALISEGEEIPLPTQVQAIQAAQEQWRDLQSLAKAVTREEDLQIRHLTHQQTLLRSNQQMFRDMKLEQEANSLIAEDIALQWGRVRQEATAVRQLQAETQRDPRLEPLLRERREQAMRSAQELTGLLSFQRRSQYEMMQRQMIGLPEGTYAQPIGASGFAQFGPTFAPFVPTTGEAGLGTRQGMEQALFGRVFGERTMVEMFVRKIMEGPINVNVMSGQMHVDHEGLAEVLTAIKGP